MEVRDGDSCSEDSIVWMGDGHVCSCLGGLGRKSAGDQDAFERVAASAERATDQVVKLNRRDALIDTRDDLLCNCCGINMLGIETITQTRDSSCDLVELNALLAPICRLIS